MTNSYSESILRGTELEKRPLRAIIYARVSTPDQVDGPSLEEQIKICRNHAVEHQMEVVDEIQDDFTGKVIDRPGFTKVLKALEHNNADVIIVAHHDRLSRNFVDFIFLREQITKNGYQLHYAKNHDQATDDFNSLMTDTIQALLAHGERLRIVERTKEGKRARARRGKNVISRLPFGYARDGNKNIIIVEDKAFWIRKIFNWYVHNDDFDHPLKLQEIADELNKRGVPAPGKPYRHGEGKWLPSVISRSLRNTFYAGKAYYGKTFRDSKGKLVHLPKEDWIEIPTPPIVSEDLFNKCQLRLEYNKIHARRKRKYKYMLSGHIKCKSCGLNFVGVSLGKDDKVKRYYRCSAANQKRFWGIYEKCSAGSKMIKAEPLERAVLRWFLDFISEDEILISSLKKMEELAYNALDKKRERLDWVSKKIIEEENLIDRLIEHFKDIDNKKVQESLIEQVNQAAARIDLLKTEQATLGAEITKESLSEKTQERILDMAREVRERLRYVSYDNMRFALNALGATVSVLIDPDDKKRVQVWITTGFPSQSFCTEVRLSL